MNPKLPPMIRPFLRFFQMEAASGIVLLFCTMIALWIANSQLHAPYKALLEEKFLFLPLHLWINDGLMAIFFFVVGMEIKRELARGELSSPKQAALPLLAALGGMVVPAAIYFFFNPVGTDSRGWGIPMATDIAFAVGVLSLFGSRVPFSLKVFLLALAIVDDLGAVLVIALFYTSEISGAALGASIIFLVSIILLQYAGIRSKIHYVILGALSWAAMLKSGVHATIAGVLI
ncbi:MAG: Na+/H+ antiporter NhaA, partial [Bdellovibrionales bacterium]|nr:Na+/H+ antiporter NhaA [Bdellovibrionales bacterium]